MSPRRSRLLGAFALAATFVVGALAGVALDRSARASPAPLQGEPVPDSVARERAENEDDDDDERRGESKLLSQVGLSPAQDTAVDAILERRRAQMEAYWDTVGPRFEAIVDSARAEIRAVLDQAQRQEYDRLRAEKQRRHDEDRERDRDG